MALVGLVVGLLGAFAAAQSKPDDPPNPDAVPEGVIRIVTDPITPDPGTAQKPVAETNEQPLPAANADAIPPAPGTTQRAIILQPIGFDESNAAAATPRSATPAAESAHVADPSTTAVEPGPATLTGALESESGEPLTCESCHRDVDCCCCGKHWIISGQWMYLQPRGSEIVYAFDSPGCFSPPLGAAEQIDWDFESGFKVGVGRLFTDDGSAGLFASYTHFEAHEADNARSVTGDGTLRPLLLFPQPGTCDALSSTSAQAHAAIEFERVELDYKRFFDCGCWRLDWLLGVAYGQLNQDASALYDTDLVRIDTDMYGYGARMGFGAEYGRGCIRGFGRSDFTLLAANQSAKYQQFNTLDGQVVHYSQDLDRLIPVLDLELGVAVDLTRRLTLRTGYMYSLWFNVVTVPDFVGAVHAGDVTGSVEDTLTFDGLFARLEFVW
jgi:hypothetical protein